MFFEERFDMWFSSSICCGVHGRAFCAWMKLMSSKEANLSNRNWSKAEKSASPIVKEIGLDSIQEKWG